MRKRDKAAFYEEQVLLLFMVFTLVSRGDGETVTEKTNCAAGRKDNEPPHKKRRLMFDLKT